HEVDAVAEEPDARRVQDGRAQVDLGERGGSVLAQGTADGEEDLQRLRGELDDGFAVDASGPAALEIHARRAEHDGLHGSVCTLTANPFLDLARASVRVLEPARAFEPEREEGDEAAVGAEEANLAWITAGRLAHDALDRPLVVRHLTPGARLRQRLEMRLDAV